MPKTKAWNPDVIAFAKRGLIGRKVKYQECLFSQCESPFRVYGGTFGKYIESKAMEAVEKKKFKTIEEAMQAILRKIIQDYEKAGREIERKKGAFGDEYINLKYRGIIVGGGFAYKEGFSTFTGYSSPSSVEYYVLILRDDSYVPEFDIRNIKEVTFLPDED